MLTGSFRGATPLSHHLPLPLDKGKGDKGGWGYLSKNLKGVRALNNRLSVK